MSPIDFQQARKISKDLSYSTIIYNQPYFPNLMVDTSIPDSILNTTITLLFSNTISSLIQENGTTTKEEKDGKEVKLLPDPSQFQVTQVKGGITNVLFCISGLSSYKPYSSILLRVFGAEGMIDRDVETSTFAELSQQKLAPPYYGRFGNGRIEGYYDDAVPLNKDDLQDLNNLKDIAVQLAKLHYEFCIPSSLHEYHDEKKPSLWGQLESWMDQASNIQTYATKGDEERAKEYYDINRIQHELTWVQTNGIPQEAQGVIAFCHNDLLAANILKRTNGDICLIDFEYGGVNYIAFDIANHFNEFCGGTSAEENGVPDYLRFPSEKHQNLFLQTYLDVKRQYSNINDHGNHDDNANEPTSNGSSTNTVKKEDDSQEEEMILFVKEVKAYVLVNHLFWGLWAVNQAASEGTTEFDYLEYAKNRFNRYFEHAHGGK